MRILRLFTVIAGLIASTIFITKVQAAGDLQGLKIGLICSGSTSDGGWNQSAKQALDKLQAQGAKTSFLEKVGEDKAADEMRDYASQDYDLVIGHGYEFLKPATEAAKDAGKTRFAVSGADKSTDSILTLDFDLSQASYQLGIIAAKVSHTGKLGFIGGEKIPALAACYRGFVAGAKSVNPAVSVVEAYTSWDDPGKSKSQAEAFLSQGIDVIYQNVDAASNGVFEAIKEHNSQPRDGTPILAYTFGSNSDQNANPICPDYTLASAVIRLDKAFTNVAVLIKNGTFKPGVQKENIANGVCVAVVNPRLKGKIISDDTLKLVDDAGKKIAAGELPIPEK